MIKNNLNIAQQVNCSGMSSSLFLFFDSKTLCAGYLLHESRPRRGGQHFLQHVAPWSLPGTDGDGKPFGTTLTYPTSVAKCYCMQ